MSEEEEVFLRYIPKLGVSFPPILAKIIYNFLCDLCELQPFKQKNTYAILDHDFEQKSGYLIRERNKTGAENYLMFVDLAGDIYEIIPEQIITKEDFTKYTIPFSIKNKAVAHLYDKDAPLKLYCKPEKDRVDLNDKKVPLKQGEPPKEKIDFNHNKKSLKSRSKPHKTTLTLNSKDYYLKPRPRPHKTLVDNKDISLQLQQKPNKDTLQFKDVSLKRDIKPSKALTKLDYNDKPRKDMQNASTPIQWLYQIIKDGYYNDFMRSEQPIDKIYLKYEQWCQEKNKKVYNKARLVTSINWLGKVLINKRVTIRTRDVDKRLKRKDITLINAITLNECKKLINDRFTNVNFSF